MIGDIATIYNGIQIPYAAHFHFLSSAGVARIIVLV